MGMDPNGNQPPGSIKVLDYKSYCYVVCVVLLFCVKEILLREETIKKRSKETHCVFQTKSMRLITF